MLTIVHTFQSRELQGRLELDITLDTSGHVAEGSAENIFIIQRGEIHTPDLNACLDGITRRTVMQLADDHGYKVTERRITRDELMNFLGSKRRLLGDAPDQLNERCVWESVSETVHATQLPRHCIGLT